MNPSYLAWMVVAGRSCDDPWPSVATCAHQCQPLSAPPASPRSSSPELRPVSSPQALSQSVAEPLPEHHSYQTQDSRKIQTIL